MVSATCCSDGTCAPQNTTCCNNGYYCPTDHPLCCGSFCCPVGSTCSQTGCIKAGGATGTGSTSGTPATTPPSGVSPGQPAQVTPPTTEGASTSPRAEDYGLGYGCGGCGNDPAADGGSDSAMTGPDAAAMIADPRGLLLLWVLGLGLVRRFRGGSR